jgi:TonB family protein
MVQDIKTSQRQVREVTKLGMAGIVMATILATGLFYISVYRDLDSFGTYTIIYIIIVLFITIWVRLYSKTSRTIGILSFHGIAWVLIFIIGIVLRQTYEKCKIETYGRKTFAIVTKLYSQRSRYSRELRAKFTYNVNGRYYKGSTNNKRGDLEVSDTVKIKYYLDDPAVYRVFATNKRMIIEPKYQNIAGNTSTVETVVDTGDRLPQFKGGSKAFYQYLRKRLIYPPIGIIARRTGSVDLSFVIEKDGSIGHVKVEKSMGADYDRAAMEVIRKSPKWLPALQKGKAVRVKYHIPIKFSL